METTLPRPPLGYQPRPKNDPHVGLRYAFGSAEKARLDALGVIDLLPNCPPNRHQYRAGSCTGQGFSHAVDYVMKQAAKDQLLGFEPYTSSSLAIYAWERMEAGTFLDDLGATLADGIGVLRRRGIPREADWPYDESKLYVIPDVRVSERAREHRLVNSRPLVHDLDEVRHALSIDCPVVAGIPVYEQMFSREAYETGRVADPESGEGIEGWHCVVFYKHDPSENRLYFKNWWQDWGVDNVGSVSEDYFLRRSNELYAIGAVR